MTDITHRNEPNMVSYDLIVPAGIDPGDPDYETRFEAERQRLEDILSREQNISRDSTVHVENIGRGADWDVIFVTIVSLAITIPEVHKKIREYAEEYNQIWGNIKSVFQRLTEGRHALYPDEYLFLVAIEHLGEIIDPAALTYKGLHRMPADNPSLKGREDILFFFEYDGNLYHIAIGRSGRVLWRGTLDIYE